MRTGRAGQLGGARDDRGLGGAVGVPDLAVRAGQPRADLGWACLAAEDEQPDGGQRLGRPQRHQGRHGRDHRDVVGDQPGPEVHAAAHQRSRRRHQAARHAPRRATSPRSEASKPTDSPAITRSPGPSGALLEEHPGLGVDEGGGRAVRDRDALGRARRAGGEDHPGVVGGLRVAASAPVARARPRRDRPARCRRGSDARLAEDRSGTLVGVVGVHRDVGRRRRAGSHDGHVEVDGAGLDADADPVAHDRRPWR